MIKEDIYCGMIWDSELNKYMGIFTIRDFLNLIKVLYEKINIHLQSNAKWTNIKNLVSHLFQRNNVGLDELDVIMENVENVSKLNSDTKSEKSEGDNMFIDEDTTFTTIENSIKNWREFFKIFEYININDYFSDIHTVSKILITE